MPALSGPRLAPRSGIAKQLVVFLHGYGSNGSDLIEIGKQWQRLLPDAAFVSPHALEAMPMAPGGRQWFPLTSREPEERWRGVTKAAPMLDEFLDEELAAAGLDDRHLAVVGFSQGAMMALHIGLRRAVAPGGIVAISGLLVGPEHLGEAKARSRTGERPPILLIHGDSDETIPVDAMFQTAEDLAEAEIPCQWHMSPGLGHGIDAMGLLHGGLFLGHCFGLPAPQR